jgi:hypothetical protein
MPKFLPCAGLRGIIIAVSLLAMPATVLAQHSAHAAPSDSLGMASHDQVLAQASP